MTIGEPPRPNYPTKFEAITELSAKALQNIVEEYGVNTGKFVRFGSLILLGPRVDIQPKGLTMMHLDIASAAYEHPDETFRQRVQDAISAADPALSIGADYRGMEDAGHYDFNLRYDKSVADISFASASTTFPRSIELIGREQTGLLAQTILGLSAHVQAG